MGAIAEAIKAYSQPLIDSTDGSIEQLNKALSISTFCYNLALLPEEKREQMIQKMQLSLKMDDAEFDDFRSSVISPMIRRHEKMFPSMHNGGWENSLQIGPSSDDSSLPERPRMESSTKAYQDRYAPCPCGSGKKFKFCCGKRGP